MYEGARHIRITEDPPKILLFFQDERFGTSILSRMIGGDTLESRAFIPADD